MFFFFFFFFLDDYFEHRQGNALRVIFLLQENDYKNGRRI